MFTGALELKRDVKYLIILRWAGAGEGGENLGESTQVSYIDEPNGGVYWGFDSLPIPTQLSSGDNSFLCQQVQFTKY